MKLPDELHVICGAGGVICQAENVTSLAVDRICRVVQFLVEPIKLVLKPIKLMLAFQLTIIERDHLLYNMNVRFVWYEVI